LKKQRLTAKSQFINSFGLANEEVCRPVSRQLKQIPFFPNGPAEGDTANQIGDLLCSNGNDCPAGILAYLSDIELKLSHAMEHEYANRGAGLRSERIVSYRQVRELRPFRSNASHRFCGSNTSSAWATRAA
jgi:hypothetical protein